MSIVYNAGIWSAWSLSEAPAPLTAGLVLILLLLVKMLVSTTRNPRLLAFGRALNIAILPLLLVFLLNVAAKVLAALS